MDTCFLFAKHLDETGCLCLKLNINGELISPLMQLPFEDIKALQEEANTIIVESSDHVSILELELNWLPESKARAAIPFALEERLAQPVDELHFAFDKQHYKNNQYLVTIIQRLRLRYITQVLASHNIIYDLITIDWFALQPNELCVTADNILVNQEQFKGALFGELVNHFITSQTDMTIYTFSDSQPTIEHTQNKSDEPSYLWIARRLLKSHPLNLCQGPFQHESAIAWTLKAYQLAAGLCGIWLISLLIVNGWQLYTINKKTDAVDKQIASIYRTYFPDAKQVISPKFRITQLLDANKQSQGHFWYVLSQFSTAIKDKNYTIEQVRYQNKGLFINLLAPDFASLESLENQLKKLQLKVTQTQAITRDQQVFATLELK